MYLLSIDGACRRNGKPDCVSAGAVFVQEIDDSKEAISYATISTCETGSTNQRGELLALTEALLWCSTNKNRVCGETVFVVTDSEYLFNSLTKEWYSRWQKCGWRTASDEPVKNADLWERIITLIDACRLIDICYYHIKGHCIPFGAVTASKLLEEDATGKKLKQAAMKKLQGYRVQKADNLKYAQDLSLRNNGFYLEPYIFDNFIVANLVVDAVATVAVSHACISCGVPQS